MRPNGCAEPAVPGILPTQTLAVIVLYMSTVKEIQEAVSQLAPEQYKAFRRWFEEHESVLWDAQIEEDVRSGKLNRLAEEAVEEYDSGTASEL